MAIIQIFADFYQKVSGLGTSTKNNKIKIINFNPIIIITLIIFLSIGFFLVNNFVNQKSLENQKNVKKITSSEEFSNLTNFLISKLNSPYLEIKYTIKNNDSLEKILKKYEVRAEDINEISTKLKRKKLSNIYSGRELSMVLK